MQEKIQSKAWVEVSAEVVENICGNYRFKSDYKETLFQNFCKFMKKGKTIRKYFFSFIFFFFFSPGKTWQQSILWTERNG